VRGVRTVVTEELGSRDVRLGVAGLTWRAGLSCCEEVPEMFFHMLSCTSRVRSFI
jgi:hypothetical protein